SESDLDEPLRGRGTGREMYRAVIDPVLARGGRVDSDASVSTAAARVYASLSRDYRVETNPTAYLEGDMWFTTDRGPVFTVTGHKSPPRPVAIPPDALLKSRPE